MSFVVYDYQCPDCGHLDYDRFVRRADADKQDCTVCGSLLHRLPCAPHLDHLRAGVDPDFGTLGDKWAKMQEQKAAKANMAKREQERDEGPKGAVELYEK